MVVLMVLLFVLLGLSVTFGFCEQHHRYLTLEYIEYILFQHYLKQV